jgi:hypothetical protein
MTWTWGRLIFYFELNLWRKIDLTINVLHIRFYYFQYR